MSKLSMSGEPLSPGDMLLYEFLLPLKITQTAFAEAVGIARSHLSDIIAGKRGISASMALRFEAALGMEATVWLDLQRDVDLYRARRELPESFANIRRLVPEGGEEKAGRGFANQEGDDD